MFMIPMPPTSSDTAAMPASSAVIVRVARSSVFPSCSSVTFSSPADVADDRAGDVRTHAAFRQRLTRLRRDGEIVRLVVADLWRARSSFVTSPMIRDTSPVDAAVMVMSFSLARFSSRWTVLNGM